MNFFPNTHLKPHTYQPYNSKLNKWISLFSKSQATLLFIYSHPNYSLTILRNYLTEQNIDTAPSINSYIKAILAAADNAKIHNDTNKDRWIFLRNHFYQLSTQYRLDAEPAPAGGDPGGEPRHPAAAGRARSAPPARGIAGRSSARRRRRTRGRPCRGTPEPSAP